MTTIHEPVLLSEVLDGLNPKPNENYIDCTFGGGGQALAILERIKPAGKLLGLDWDPQAVQTSQQGNLILVNDNYKNLKKIVNDTGLGKVNGILLDLGLSSDQLGSTGRGFSFQSQGFLDLRYNPDSHRPTAAEILRTYSEQELTDLFKEYGEEPLARPIARRIVESRQRGQAIETADMLVQLVSNEYRRRFKNRSRRQPATRVFQALRIAVNDEYGNLQAALPAAIDVLEPKGRLAVISFQSGEDRLVKHFFKQAAAKDNPTIRILTKKPITASAKELAANWRSRSAKLRIIEKL